MGVRGGQGSARVDPRRHRRCPALLLLRDRAPLGGENPLEGKVEGDNTNVAAPASDGRAAIVAVPLKASDS